MSTNVNMRKHAAAQLRRDAVPPKPSFEDHGFSHHLLAFLIISARPP
jgi:hypothetical protein